MTWEYKSSFFDADSYISFSNPGNQKYKTVIFGFTNIYRSILEEIQDYIFKETGEKGFIVKKAKRKEKHSDSFDLKYSNTPKIKVLRNISSIHPIKKARIQLVISKLESLTLRNGRYSNKILDERVKFEAQFFAFGK